MTDRCPMPKLAQAQTWSRPSTSPRFQFGSEKGDLGIGYFQVINFRYSFEKPESFLSLLEASPAGKTAGAVSHDNPWIKHENTKRFLFENLSETSSNLWILSGTAPRSILKPVTEVAQGQTTCARDKACVPFIEFNWAADTVRYRTQSNLVIEIFPNILSTNGVEF